MIKNLNVSEILIDWNLWPRAEVGDLDSTHIQRLKDAISAGAKLPPVIVSKTDYRLIDGFHRVKAYQDLFKEKAEIEAELKTYHSEAEMFIDSIRYNSKHGMPLTPKDRAHVILKARKFQIDAAILSDALGMEKERIQRLFDHRTAKLKDGRTIVLPHGASKLAGQTLDDTQAHFAKTSNGTLPIVHARILLNALNAQALGLNEKSIRLLKQLKNAINRILREAAHERIN